MKGRSGYWIVVHNIQENNSFSNKYYSYEITAMGVNPVPVVSKLGPLPKATSDFAGNSKFSPCGDLYATVFQNSAFVILMDFDAYTGYLSNVRQDISTINTQNAYAYGLEFSANGNLLYVATRGDNSNTKILQYSTTTNSSLTFTSSLITLTDTKLEGITGIQRGPDDKIYFIYANAKALGVIHNPNNLGVSCNIDPVGLSLKGKASVGSSLGLPNFVSSFFCDEPYIKTSKPCFGNFTNIWLSGNLAKIDSVHFNYGDLKSQSNTSSNQLDSHKYIEPGIYNITAITFETYSGNIITDTIKQRIEISGILSDFLGSDTSICKGDSVPLKQNYQGIEITWLTPFLEGTYCAKKEGIYYAGLTLNGCFGMDTLVIKHSPKPVVNLGSDTTICESELLLISKDYNSKFTYKWEDGYSGHKKLIYESGGYSITVEGSCVVASDSILIGNCLCRLKFPNVFTPNNDGYNDFYKPIGNCDVNNYELVIYNRWGIEIFVTKNISNSWDGYYKDKKCLPGVYFWSSKYHNSENHFINQNGVITLMLD